MRVAFDCIALDELDRAHTHTITARAAVDAAENALRVALGGECSGGPLSPPRLPGSPTPEAAGWRAREAAGPTTPRGHRLARSHPGARRTWTRPDRTGVDRICLDAHDGARGIAGGSMTSAGQRHVLGLGLGREHLSRTSRAAASSPRPTSPSASTATSSGEGELGGRDVLPAGRHRAFTGFQRMTGTLGGKKGSFVLRADGTFADGQART